MFLYAKEEIRVLNKYFYHLPCLPVLLCSAGILLWGWLPDFHKKEVSDLIVMFFLIHLFLKTLVIFDGYWISLDTCTVGTLLNTCTLGTPLIYFFRLRMSLFLTSFVTFSIMLNVRCLEDWPGVSFIHCHVISDQHRGKVGEGGMICIDLPSGGVIWDQLRCLSSSWTCIWF